MSLKPKQSPFTKKNTRETGEITYTYMQTLRAVIDFIIKKLYGRHNADRN